MAKYKKIDYGIKRTLQRTMSRPTERRRYQRPVVRAMATLVLVAFLLNTVYADYALALAPWTKAVDPAQKCAFLAQEYRDRKVGLLWFANSDRYKDLLNAHNAKALLLPVGKYLIHPDIAANDLLLVRAVTHEDFEILMQREEKLHPTRYHRLFKQILGDKAIVSLYRELSHYKRSKNTAANKIFNDLIANAFEIISLIDEGLVRPEKQLTETDRKFARLMRPILEAKDSIGRHKNFPAFFFDRKKRTRLIRGLQDDTKWKFYRVASTKAGGDTSKSSRIIKGVKELEKYRIKITAERNPQEDSTVIKAEITNRADRNLVSADVVAKVWHKERTIVIESFYPKFPKRGEEEIYVEGRGRALLREMIKEYAGYEIIGNASSLLQGAFIEMADFSPWSHDSGRYGLKRIVDQKIDKLPKDHHLYSDWVNTTIYGVVPHAEPITPDTELRIGEYVWTTEMGTGRVIDRDKRRIKGGVGDKKKGSEWDLRDDNLTVRIEFLDGASDFHAGIITTGKKGLYGAFWRATEYDIAEFKKDVKQRAAASPKPTGRVKLTKAERKEIVADANRVLGMISRMANVFHEGFPTPRDVNLVKKVARGYTELLPEELQAIRDLILTLKAMSKGAPKAKPDKRAALSKKDRKAEGRGLPTSSSSEPAQNGFESIELSDREKAYIFDMPANPVYNPGSPVMFAAYDHWVDAFDKTKSDEHAEKAADSIIKFADYYKERYGTASVAIVSYWTTKSGTHTLAHPLAHFLEKALDIARARRPDIDIIGEGTLQLDAALMPDVYKSKVVVKSLPDGFPPKIFIFSNFHALEIAKDTMAFHAGRKDVKPDPSLRPQYLEELENKARANGPRLVMPEAKNPEILKAAAKFIKNGIGEVVLLGNSAEIKAIAEQNGIDINGAQIIDPLDGLMNEEWQRSCGECYYRVWHKEIAELTAVDIQRGWLAVNRFITKKIPPLIDEKVKEGKIRGAGDLIYGAWMVATGGANCMVAGKEFPSECVIYAMRTLIGVADGVKVLSAGELYSTDFADIGTNGRFVLADITGNPCPDARALADIAINTAKTVQCLISPKVKMAFIFDEEGQSRKIPDAIKLAKAALGEGVVINGPMAADEALTGGYNAIIAPDLPTANELYKQYQRINNYEALSLTTGGAPKAINDLSRGADANEIYTTMLVAACSIPASGKTAGNEAKALYEKGEVVIKAEDGQEFMFRLSVKHCGERGVEDDLLLNIFALKGTESTLIGYRHAMLYEGRDWERWVSARNALERSELINPQVFKIGAPGIFILDAYRKRGIAETAQTLILQVAQLKKAYRFVAEEVNDAAIPIILKCGFRQYSRLSPNYLEFLLKPEDMEREGYAFPPVKIKAAPPAAPAEGTKVIQVSKEDLNELKEAVMRVINEAHDQGIRTIISMPGSGILASRFLKRAWDLRYPQDNVVLTYYSEAAEEENRKIAGRQGPYLLFDDYAVTGATLQAAVEDLRDEYKLGQEVYVGALLMSETGSFLPENNRIFGKIIPLSIRPFWILFRKYYVEENPPADIYYFLDSHPGILNESLTGQEVEKVLSETFPSFLDSLADEAVRSVRNEEDTTIYLAAAPTEKSRGNEGRGMPEPRPSRDSGDEEIPEKGPGESEFAPAPKGQSGRVSPDRMAAETTADKGTVSDLSPDLKTPPDGATRSDASREASVGSSFPIGPESISGNVTETDRLSKAMVLGKEFIERRKKEGMPLNSGHEAVIAGILYHLLNGDQIEATADVDRLLVKALRKNGIRRILDLGCGDCALLAGLAEVAKESGCELTGIDIDPTPEGEKVREVLKAKRIPVIAKDAMEFVDTGGFDLIIASGVMSFYGGRSVTSPNSRGLDAKISETSDLTEKAVGLLSGHPKAALIMNSFSSILMLHKRNILNFADIQLWVISGSADWASIYNMIQDGWGKNRWMRLWRQAANLAILTPKPHTRESGDRPESVTPAISPAPGESKDNGKEGRGLPEPSSPKGSSEMPEPAAEGADIVPTSKLSCAALDDDISKLEDGGVYSVMHTVYGYGYEYFSLQEAEPGEVDDAVQAESIRYLKKKLADVKKFTDKNAPDATLIIVRVDKGGGIKHIKACLWKGRLLSDKKLFVLYKSLIKSHASLEKALFEAIEKKSISPDEALRRNKELHEIHSKIVLIGILIDKPPVASHYAIAAERGNLEKYGLPDVAVRISDAQVTEIALPVFETNFEWWGGKVLRSGTSIKIMCDRMQEQLKERFGNSVSCEVESFNIGHKDWSTDFYLPTLTLPTGLLPAVAAFLKQQAPQLIGRKDRDSGETEGRGMPSLGKFGTGPEPVEPFDKSYASPKTPVLKTFLNILGIGTIWFGRQWPPNNASYVYPEYEEVRDFLDRAFEKIGGENATIMIDTAAAYGLSEEMIGRYFAERRNRIPKTFIATKWGEEFDISTGKSTIDHSKERLIASVGRSLERLGWIDLLYIHEVTLEVLRNEDVMKEMARMKEQRYGGIKYIGASISNEDVLNTAVKENLIERLDVIQMPISIFLNRPDLIKSIKIKGVAIVINSPIRKGDSRKAEEIYADLLGREEISVILTGTRHHLEETMGYAISRRESSDLNKDAGEGAPVKKDEAPKPKLAPDGAGIISGYGILDIALLENYLDDVAAALGEKIDSGVVIRVAGGIRFHNSGARHDIDTNLVVEKTPWENIDIEELRASLENILKKGYDSGGSVRISEEESPRPNMKKFEMTFSNGTNKRLEIFMHSSWESCAHWILKSMMNRFGDKDNPAIKLKGLIAAEYYIGNLGREEYRALLDRIESWKGSDIPPEWEDRIKTLKDEIEQSEVSPQKREAIIDRIIVRLKQRISAGGAAAEGRSLPEPTSSKDGDDMSEPAARPKPAPPSDASAAHAGAGAGAAATPSPEETESAQRFNNATINILTACFTRENVVRSTVVPWEEAIHDTKKQPTVEYLLEEMGDPHGKIPMTEEEKRQNQRNYLKNQKRVRIEFLNLVADIMCGKVKSKGSKEDPNTMRNRLARLNRILLTGYDGDSIYVTPTIIYKSGGSKEDFLEWYKHEVAGHYRIEAPYSFTERQVSEIYEKLEAVLKDSETKELEKYIRDVYSFYLSFMNYTTRPFDLFVRGNNSLFMNFANALLRLRGLNGISHQRFETAYLRNRRSDVKMFGVFLNLVKARNPDIFSGSGTKTPAAPEQDREPEGRGLPEPTSSKDDDDMAGKGPDEPKATPDERSAAIPQESNIQEAFQAASICLSTIYQRSRFFAIEADKVKAQAEGIEKTKISKKHIQQGLLLLERLGLLEKDEKSGYMLIDWVRRLSSSQIKTFAAILQSAKGNSSYETLRREFFMCLLLARLEAFKSYMAPLSEKGIAMLAKAHAVERKEEATEDEIREALKLLYNPEAEWFKPCFDRPTRKEKALIKNCSIINFTWGCSMQCDYCFANAPKVSIMPWPWIKEISGLLDKSYNGIIMSDPLRDYYDPIFDRTFADICDICSIPFIPTSGFEPGSFGERAAREIHARHPEMKAVFCVNVVSGWIRRVGKDRYVECMKYGSGIFGDEADFITYGTMRKDEKVNSLEVIEQITGEKDQFHGAVCTGRLLRLDPSRYIGLEYGGGMFDFKNAYQFMPNGDILQGPFDHPATEYVCHRKNPGTAALFDYVGKPSPEPDWADKIAYRHFYFADIYDIYDSEPDIPFSFEVWIKMSPIRGYFAGGRFCNKEWWGVLKDFMSHAKNPAEWGSSVFSWQFDDANLEYAGYLSELPVMKSSDTGKASLRSEFMALNKDVLSESKHLKSFGNVTPDGIDNPQFFGYYMFVLADEIVKNAEAAEKSPNDKGVEDKIDKMRKLMMVIREYVYRHWDAGYRVKSRYLFAPASGSTPRKEGRSLPNPEDGEQPISEPAATPKPAATAAQRDMIDEIIDYIQNPLQKIDPLVLEKRIKSVFPSLNYSHSSLRYKMTHVLTVIQCFNNLIRQDFEYFYKKLLEREDKSRFESEDEKQKYVSNLRILYGLYNSLAPQVQRDLTLAIILHDIGFTVEGIDDPNHPAKGAELARLILTHMKLPEESITRICEIIKYHDYAGNVVRGKKVPRVLRVLSPELLKLVIIANCMDMAGYGHGSKDENVQNNLVPGSLEKALEYSKPVILKQLDEQNGYFEYRLRKLARSEYGKELSDEEFRQLMAEIDKIPEPEREIFVKNWNSHIEVRSLPFFFKIAHENNAFRPFELVQVLRSIAKDAEHYLRENTGADMFIFDSEPASPPAEGRGMPTGGEFLSRPPLNQPVVSVGDEQDAEAVRKAFDDVDAIITDRDSMCELKGPLSELNGTCQRRTDISLLHICLPIEALKDSADMRMTFERLGKSRSQFRLVVTGATKEDEELIDRLNNRADIKQALHMPENVAIEVISEDVIKARAALMQYDGLDPINRTRIVKDLYLEMLGRQELGRDEAMAIGTVAGSVEEADRLVESEDLKQELADNISIRMLVRPEASRSVFSLSAILNDWLTEIQKGNKSSLSKILPVMISPEELIRRLGAAVANAWRVLAAA